MEDVGGIAQFQKVPRSFLNTAEEAAAPVIKKTWSTSVKDTASVKGALLMMHGIQLL